MYYTIRDLYQVSHICKNIFSVRNMFDLSSKHKQLSAIHSVACWDLILTREFCNSAQFAVGRLAYPEGVSCKIQRPLPDDTISFPWAATLIIWALCISIVSRPVYINKINCTHPLLSMGCETKDCLYQPHLLLCLTLANRSLVLY